MTSEKPNVLVTGASGYIGGRLQRLLTDNGYHCYSLLRRPSAVHHETGSRVKAIRGDLLLPERLNFAAKDIETAFYLVHSMGTKGDFRREDKVAARNFVKAAGDAGIRRIIYLGGLGNDENDLSDHLQSRHEVGEILRSTGIQVIEFRASIIVGSGSLSYELVRSLVERLPIMITPRWVTVAAQPISINDVLDYLVAAVELQHTGNLTLEIGGKDIVTYEGIMLEYARQRGLRRCMVHVPFLTPYLSSLWLGLVTPIYARIGRKLIDSIRYPTVVNHHKALITFDITPRGIRESIAEALRNEDREFAETGWADSISSSGNRNDWGGVRFGNRLVDSREIVVDATPEEAFAPIRKIGGNNGWYFANWLWKLRGFLDLLVGGIGMRRGRRDPNTLRTGDRLDWWRVEVFEPNRLVRLFAEMKLPGRAWLEFEVSEKEQRTVIRQTAIFDPVGVPGNLYWFAVYPLHAIIFAQMLKNIAKRCGV